VVRCCRLQELVGAGLCDFIAAGKREELFLVGKIWQTEHRPADARSAGVDGGNRAWPCRCGCALRPRGAAACGRAPLTCDAAAMAAQGIGAEEHRAAGLQLPGPVPHPLAGGVAARQ
jgi:hypothetical protein